VTTLFTAPTMYRSMIEHVANYDLKSLHMCVSAGEHLPATMRAHGRPTRGPRPPISDRRAKLCYRQRDPAVMALAAGVAPISLLFVTEGARLDDRYVCLFCRECGSAVGMPSRKTHSDSDAITYGQYLRFASASTI
jgi:hypothetical protein